MRKDGKRMKMEFCFPMEPGEHWWGGSSDSGTQQPFTAASRYAADFRVEASNQTMPLYLSDHGRYIWSEEPFRVEIADGVLRFFGAEMTLVKAGETLRDAYRAAMAAHFPFSGKRLPDTFFTTAQYNTWMEFTYFPTQEKTLAYAHGVVDHGFTPGILIIDEGWHGRYGDWRFNPLTFPDPKAMVDELHALGFKLMLWVTPYVTTDGRSFILRADRHRDPENDKHFLRVKNEAHDVSLIHWWNGYGTALDLTNPYDIQFLDDQLQALMRDYGVDGFKFDGGTLGTYTPANCLNGTPDTTHTPAELNQAWNAFGERYEYHEYKDTWKGGGHAVIQRLRDKGHRWDGDGINTLIPNSIAQGLIGHPFICPDMIGGGEWSYNLIPGFRVDEELFIRMAQVSAFCPMMQFSWAPWRVLSPEGLRLVQDAAALHSALADEILALVRAAERGGEPIVRCMEYEFPGCGYAEITDQFLLGSDILVAPIVTPHTVRRNVVLPAGRWTDDRGTVFDGGQTISADAPLDRVVWFRREK